MKKLLIIAGILCFTYNLIVAQTPDQTLVSFTGTVSAPAYSGTPRMYYIVIRPNGAEKVKITFHNIDFLSGSTGNFGVLDGDPENGLEVQVFQESDNFMEDYYGTAPSPIISSGNTITIGYYQVDHSGWEISYTGISSQWVSNGSNISFDNGNVGIGILTPDFPLTVEKPRGNTFARFGLNAPVYMISSQPNIGFNAYYENGWKFGKTNVSSYGGFLNFDQSGGKFSFYSSTATGNEGGTMTGTCIMTLTRDGKLGLGTGTTTPTNKLTIQQATTSYTEGINIKSGSNNWYMFSNAANNLTISKSSTPANGITIDGNAATTMAIGDYWTTGKSSLKLGISAATNGYSIIQAIKLKTTEAGGVLVLNPEGGNVGIGTSIPQNTLDINGSLSIDDNFIFEGEDKWIMHTRDDGTTLFIAPWGTTDWAWNKQTRFEKNGTVSFSGNIGIGITDPTSALEVNGTIRAKEIKVELANWPTWPDFVFTPTYKLRTLAEVEQFIKANGHLPGIPKTEEVQKEGVNLGEMQAKLLQKVEELTLYILQQEKTIRHQNEVIQMQDVELKKVADLEREIIEIKAALKK